MPQNIYDDAAFFAGYRQLRETGAGLNDAVEQPALSRLLPPLEGARVLDLGCGFGDFARRARRLGAARVVGIDVSSRMLELARARTDDPAIEYRRLPIEELSASDGRFDVVVSSLALHYVADYAGALRRIVSVLEPGGRLVFSVEHPICTALPEQRWCVDGAGRELHWPVDRYHEAGERQTTWFVEGVIKYHRPVEAYVNGLLDAGLRLARLEEPAPTPQALAERPSLELHARRPPFLLLAADLPPATGSDT